VLAIFVDFSDSFSHFPCIIDSSPSQLLRLPVFSGIVGSMFSKPADISLKVAFVVSSAPEMGAH
jgi:hypothetical protein